MGIFGVGATFNNTEDVSKDFIDNNIAGIGWGEKYAPDLYQFIQSLKVGDIIYIKSFAPTSQTTTIKAIGIIIDDKIVKKFSIGEHKIGIGRNIKWLNKKTFTIKNPQGKHNVVNNSFYEEFNPEIQKAIIDRI